jgi:hypothetical protein
MPPFAINDLIHRYVPKELIFANCGKLGVYPVAHENRGDDHREHDPGAPLGACTTVFLEGIPDTPLDEFIADRVPGVMARDGAALRDLVIARRVLERDLDVVLDVGISDPGVSKTLVSDT